MADISQLALFAQRFSLSFAPLYEAVQHQEWQELDGFRLVDVPKSQRITEILYGLSGQLHPFIAELELSLIEVTGEIRPHRHLTSDAVVLLNPRSEWRGLHQYAYFEPGFWESVKGGRLLVIPRGTVHGFKLDGREGTHFSLLAANWPPLPEGDIEYV